MINITPDIDFIRKLRKDSGSALKTCMQCGNCSVVCTLSEENNPFPRKEMIWAAWGLKDQLIGDPNIWLCHQCGDCSTHCPRGVKPGEVLASIRAATILHYSKPRFFGKMLQHPWLLLLAFFIPMLVIHIILLLSGTLTNSVDPVNYSEFFPHAWVNGSFTFIFLLTLAGMISGIRKFNKDVYLHLEKDENPISFSVAFKEVLKNILGHSKFGKCVTNQYRKLAHLLVFYGFVSLLVVTMFAILATILKQYPMPFFHPVKILGNLAGLSITTGLAIMIYFRLTKKDGISKSSLFDWVFPISLLSLVISGFFTEIGRFLNWHFAYYIYIFHLIFMWFIVLYLPYTKFSHMVYRFVALIVLKRNKQKISVD